jgi:transposase-like protein
MPRKRPTSPEWWKVLLCNIFHFREHKVTDCHPYRFYWKCEKCKRTWHTEESP